MNRLQFVLLLPLISIKNALFSRNFGVAALNVFFWGLLITIVLTQINRHGHWHLIDISDVTDKLMILALITHTLALNTFMWIKELFIGLLDFFNTNERF